MNNAWDEVKSILSQADDIDSAVSKNAQQMAKLLLRNGNLRRLHAGQLCDLKRALREFDMVTGQWK